MEIVSSEVAKAKAFWRRVDIDDMFGKLSGYLNKLREMIKTDTASDREYVWSMTMVLESEISFCADGEIDPIEEVLISSELLLSRATKPCDMSSLEKETECEWETDSPAQGQSSRKEKDWPSQLCSPGTSPTSPVQLDCDMPILPAPQTFLEPLSSVQPSFKTHDCSPACVPCLHLSADDLMGQNPLEVPLLYRFQRVLATPLQTEPVCLAILYKAPCGRSLRSPDEVLHFLCNTESDAVLRTDDFSFSADVEVVQASGSPSVGLLEMDLSKRAELMPIQLCNEVDGAKPTEFRYRKDRWPHGCFVSPAPLFSACCDCTNGCTDAARCSCLQLSLRAGGAGPQLYTHRRLLHPVPTGIYECGPWCGCDRGRCQNRLVQEGLRIRLQVFRTWDRGWGVRCRDDLDQGTFVCTYAGMLLRAASGGPLPLKRKREELPSDDEVEVIEEWKVPPEETSVIKGPTDLSPLLLDEEPNQAEDKMFLGIENEARLSSKEEADKGRTPYMPCHVDQGHSDEETGLGKGLWENSEDHLYYLDATEEGNVARFFNHSCQPNLFVQNVFFESHDRNYPTVAFFTSRPVKAGTELTWNYSHEPGSIPERDVPRQCGSESCRGTVN